MAKKKKRDKTPKRPKFNPPAYRLPEPGEAPLRFLTPDDPGSNGCYCLDYTFDMATKVLTTPMRNDDLAETVNPALYKQENAFRAARTLTDILCKQKQAISYDDAMKKDAIDARQMSYVLKTDVNLMASHLGYLFQTDSILHVIPCFTEGIIHEVKQTVVHWKILSLDLERNLMRVAIDNYFHIEDALPVSRTGNAADDRGIWCLSSKTIATISIRTDEQANEILIYDDEKGVTRKPIAYHIEVKPEDILQAEQIAQSVNLQSIGLNQSERYSFNIIFRNAGKHYHKSIVQTLGLTLFFHSVYSFLFVISGVNMFLDRKPARKPAQEKVRELTQKLPQTQTKQTGQMPEKTVRVVDMITFLSESTPRKPTVRNIARYLTPEWQVRGHTRKYKSGKVVYIKPHINHRRKPTDHLPDGNRPQQIIRIRDNTDPEI